MSGVGPLLIGDRPLPHRPDAERAVLSCVLQSPKEHLEDVLEYLSDDAFYVPVNRKILSELRGMLVFLPAGAMDMVTLTEMFGDCLAEIGGDEYLLQLYNLVPTTANLEAYVKLVLQAKALRDLIRAGSELVGRCYESMDPAGLLEEHTETLHEISNAGLGLEDEAVSAADGIKALQLTVHEAQKTGEIGLPTGFMDLDNKLNGLRKGAVYIIAGRPSLGKSSLASNIATYIADRKQVPVLFFSLEMSVEELTLRMVASHIREHVDEREPPMAYEKGTEYVKNLPLYIDATPRLTSAQLLRRATRAKRKHGIGFVVVDYLQLMATMPHLLKSNRERQVAYNSAEIKRMAGELGIPVMLLCQLNRQADTTGRPKLSQLRESGAIEQDAHVVAMLYQKPDKDADEAAEHGRGRETGLVLAKHRNGPTGTVMLQFFKTFTRFDNISRIEDADVSKMEPAENPEDLEIPD